MKRIIKSSLALFAVALLASCGNQSDSSSHTNHEGHSHEASELSNAPTASVTLKNDKLNAVYQHYLHLTTAITNEDTSAAKIASAAIEAGARVIEGGASLAASAARTTTARDIEAQRKEYSNLSNEFITQVKKSGLSSGELYVDYCPMALNDEGAYWLSHVKEIRNPYFGDEMLECGSVKETIK